MPKILVADDNSNIQKMVGLALKDQGIEVVAVGNGEAAVRKISDLHPDLVLADVFMPVRNGYEVCEYVKKDTALAHIPVILLVGAFDPLDEQEAQRVGADGVLKKPFVPPDPLISMVKSALARVGVAVPGVPVEKAAAPETVAAAEVNIPKVAAFAPKTPEIVPAAHESFESEIGSRSPALQIAPGEQPVAFGSLLETPEAGEEAGYTTSVHPEFAAGRDWRSDEPAEETGEKEESFVDEVAASARDWRESSFEEMGVKAQSSQNWTPTTEKQQIAADPDADVRERIVAAVTELHGATAAEPFARDALAAKTHSAPEKNGVAEIPQTGTVPEKSFDTRVATAVLEKHEAPEIAPTSAEPEAASTTETAASTEKAPPANSWFSTPPSSWDTEVQKAKQLSSAWDAAIAPVETVAPVTPASSADPVHSEELKTAGSSHYEGASAPSEHADAGAGDAEVDAHESSGAYANENHSETIAESSLPAGAIEALREETAHVVEDEREGSTDAIRAEVPSANGQQSMDELVAKVMAKMSPEVLEAVTRQILKPVVEAMVRDEIDGKKS